MKKFLALMLMFAFIAGAGFISSCSKDDKDKVTSPETGEAHWTQGFDYQGEWEYRVGAGITERFYISSHDVITGGLYSTSGGGYASGSIKANIISDGLVECGDDAYFEAEITDVANASGIFVAQTPTTVYFYVRYIDNDHIAVSRQASNPAVATSDLTNETTYTRQ